MSVGNVTIPVFRDKFARSWPTHAEVDRKEQAFYLPLANALTRSYSTDAHFCGYSVPDVPRRLGSEEVFAELSSGVPMVLFIIDVEPAGHAEVTADWWAAELAKLERLHAAHPGGYVYRTRGGYRIIYQLAVPFVVACAADKAQWSATYHAWLDVLKERFEIVGDRSCHDWTRLYRLPRVTRDGKRQELETIGDASAIGTWAEAVAPPPPAPASRPRPSYTPRPGDFDIDHFMSAVAPDARQYQQRGRRCWDVECPNEANHSSKAKRDAVVTFSSDEGPTFHCLHDHCVHLHWKDYRKHHDPTWIPFDERPVVGQKRSDREPPPSGDEAPHDDAQPDAPDDIPPPSDDDAPTSRRAGASMAANAVGLATRYIADHATHADGVALRRWRGDWYRWFADRGCYAAQTDEQIESSLYRTLNLTKRAEVSDVRHALIAVDDVLIDHAELGTWLGGAVFGDDPLDLAACRNGLLHLPTGAMTAATPRHFSTTSLGADFDPEAPPPRRWLEFLNQLWPDDADSIAALQEWIGYLLTPDTRQQKILMVVGPKRSGKGTVARVATALIGTANVANPTLASLATNFGLWPLIGKPAAIIGDARLGGRTDGAQVVERLLSISGEDGQTIDRKHREPWTGRLPTRITIVSNELPRFSDASDALPARMLMLELSRSWYGHEDTGLTDALLGELPGILLWAIEGWRRLRARGRFVQPASSAASIDEMTDLASPVAAWSRERCNTCEPEPQWWLKCEDAYQNFCKWCELNGHHKPSQVVFGRDIRAATGCPRVQIRRGDKGDRVRVYQGLALRSDVFQ